MNGLIDNVQNAIDVQQSQLEKLSSQVQSNENTLDEISTVADHNTRLFKKAINDNYVSIYYKTWIFGAICTIQGLALTYLLFFR